MAKEIKGFYIKKRKKLFNDFSQTVGIMKILLAEQYGKEMTDLLSDEFVKEYEKIIPEIPYFKGFRQKMFNDMLLITAQIIAVYRVLNKYSKTPEEIWVLCYEVLRQRLEKIPVWKQRMSKWFWHSVFARMLQQRGKKNLQETMGLFELE